jgi:iron complex transport system ATP-binding protein
LADLRIEHVCVQYGSKPILRDVSLSLAAGECVALLGPNGAGKSTLLLSVLGAISLTTGSVWLDGARLTERSGMIRAKAIAYVPQDSALPFDYAVRDYVAMGRFPHAAGLFETHADWAAIEQAMAQAECAEFAERRLSELSGGERQRVALARAIAQAAPIWLLDEPTSHLDIAHQRHLVAMARRHVATGGSILAVVHDINLATELADRIAVLHAGRLVLMDDVERAIYSPLIDEVFETPFVRIRHAERTVLLPSRSETAY